MDPELKEEGEAVGIDYTMKCDRYPYTPPVHALLEHVADEHGLEKQNHLFEVIYKVRISFEQ